jgi:ribosomal protein S27E
MVPSEERNRGKFVRVICHRCGTKHVVFGKSSTKVKCVKCNKLLVRTAGGKVKIRTIIEEVLK